MVALISRLILLAQLLITAGITLVLIHFAQFRILPAATISIAILIAVRMLITANNFRLACRFRSETPQQFRISLLQACRLYLEEFCSTMITSSWTMPFRALRIYIATQPKGIPVLLIHGYGCNSGYWRSMSRALREAGITHHAVNLEPVFGDIDDFVPEVREAIETLCRKSGHQRIILLCHSMGGLVARAYLCAHGTSNIAKVITLGTPHHGTALAEFGAGLNSEQMRWISHTQDQHSKLREGALAMVDIAESCPAGCNGMPGHWLKQLAKREDPAHYKLFTSIYSHQDNIIAPQTSSHLPGAYNIELHGIGHVALGLNSRVLQIVIDEILATNQQD
ncbi:triacylglycerol esterase/lipase EstA (alpha/beta hydrolase family) [Paucimonas lemoignei]|uniref:Triacylglycerol esterase/lipase EstA (Alpha/beta hydrolase family) n=1 Tax=Paucimonas lemoignei TaxID=29443 RepID=A0A4R3I1X4_PAULE|nr:alpha/beta fold hydrolase [Paucimonas lemoignei]TCS39608.1 triacylglycerol esterase/lipase EstA (alpha/beta hydrolase family) [Paucimonas lemoignei]